MIHLGADALLLVPSLKIRLSKLLCQTQGDSYKCLKIQMGIWSIPEFWPIDFCDNEMLVSNFYYSLLTMSNFNFGVLIPGLNCILDFTISQLPWLFVWATILYWYLQKQHQWYPGTIWKWRWYRNHFKIAYKTVINLSPMLVQRFIIIEVLIWLLNNEKHGL